jgi:hypothetical protein
MLINLLTLHTAVESAQRFAMFNELLVRHIRKLGASFF